MLAPDVIVIPQFQLDIVDDKPLADTSITTTAQAAAKELTPDFSIAVSNLIRRHVPAALPAPPLFPADFNLWRAVRENMMKIPLIAELKRPPTRRVKSRYNFSQDLLTRLVNHHRECEGRFSQTGRVCISYAAISRRDSISGMLRRMVVLDDFYACYPRHATGQLTPGCGKAPGQDWRY